MDKEFPELQKVMERCYEGWQTELCGKQISYKNFLLSLSPLDRSVIVCCNLNYQVQNGGLEQWFENEYDVGADFVFWVLGQVGTETCKKVEKILTKAMGARDEMEEARSENDSMEIEEDYFDELDIEYYEICDAFLTDVSDWFQKQTG